jgi:hypothetical protein
MANNDKEKNSQDKGGNRDKRNDDPKVKPGKDNNPPPRKKDQW